MPTPDASVYAKSSSETALFPSPLLSMEPSNRKPWNLQALPSIQCVAGTSPSPSQNAKPHVSLNVTSYFNNGSTGIFPNADCFCTWADIMQDDSTDAVQVDREDTIPAQE
ncbi:MAG: hypothetical protein Q9217_003332 [Psora testacea]